jgi:hypothetical protein
MQARENLMRNLFKLFGIVGALVVVATGSNWAAIPTNVIKGWQDHAPEAVEITVLSIDELSAIRPFGEMGSGGSQTTTQVTLTARVDVVHRTASNLVPGSVIVVHYVHTSYKAPLPPPGAGDTNILLDIRDRAAAYLKKTRETTYEPAGAAGCLVKL